MNYKLLQASGDTSQTLETLVDRSRLLEIRGSPVSGGGSAGSNPAGGTLSRTISHQGKQDL